jgi:ubiquinone/menaquinone biosynthesis C-methylase UbiE
MRRLEEGGRVDPGSAQSFYERALLARHIFAYSWVTDHFLKPGDHVLEIGSGEGYGSALMAKKAGRVTAIDAGEDAIAHASSKYSAVNLDFRTHDGEHLPFPDAGFDKVVSFQVIEHVKDPLAFLKEAARVLKPGGSAYLTTPNRVHRLKKGQKPWYKFHITEFSAAGISGLLAAVFGKYEVNFITAPREYFEMELEVARIATLAQRFDRLGLRNLAPYRLKQLVFGLLSGKDQAGKPEPKPSDYSVIKEDRNGLDLWIEATL